MRKRRAWQHTGDDDPLSGLINLFDLWIVVVIALTLALLQSAATLDSSEASNSTVAEESSEKASAAEQIDTATQRLPRFRRSESELSGQGELLGTAYRLQSGEVVYVPKK